MPAELYNLGPVCRAPQGIARPGCSQVGFAVSAESPIYPKVGNIGFVLKSANLILSLVNREGLPIGSCKALVYSNGVFLFEVLSDSGDFSLLIEYNRPYMIFVESDLYQTRDIPVQYAAGINRIPAVMYRKTFAAAGPGGLYINADPSNPESNLFI